MENGRAEGRQAAVLIVVRAVGTADPQILLTKRAASLNSHAGEIAFPGGMQDPEDRDLLATALRETYEEVGLGVDRLVIQARLNRAYTRQGTAVSPFFAHLLGDAPLNINPQEIEHTFWVPYSFLIADARLQTDVFVSGGREFWAPAYEFEGHLIWGFTSRVLVEFMNGFAGQALAREHAAPEVVRQ